MTTAAPNSTRMDERMIYAYSPLDGLFSLYVWRCYACGTTGRKGSWCEGHNVPRETGAESLKIKRRPVLIPFSSDLEDGTASCESELVYEGDDNA